jgi:AraC-like DNA-binding protein
VPRQTQNADGSYQTEWYNLFSPKAIAGTEDILRTTKSRCITFKMAKATRPIPIFIDKERARTLRSKLLQYRFDEMLDCEAREPREAATRYGGVDKAIDELCKVSSGRLTELFLPLYQVTPMKYRGEILDYVQNLRAERTREMGLSEETLVLTAIIECKKEGTIQKNLILIKWINEKMNKQADYNELWSNQQLGQIIGRLGFEKQHTRQGNALVWNEGLIKKLEVDPRYETAFKQIEMSDAHPTEGSPASQLHSLEPEDFPKESKQ